MKTQTKYLLVLLVSFSLYIFTGCQNNPSGPQNPELQVSPENLEFSVWDSVKTFQILNNGEGSLKWNVAENPDYSWMGLTPVNGSDESRVEVSVNQNEVRSGRYEGTISVSSNGGNREIELYAEVPYFKDKFSKGLINWTEQFSDAWIADGELHLTGNQNGYYGSVYQEFYTPLPMGYCYQIKMARLSHTEQAMYGPIIGFNDKGTIKITKLWFCVLDDSDRNWHLIGFLSSPVFSTWALLDSDSYGDSPLIKTGSGEWNDIRLTVDQEKTVSVHVGDAVLYTSGEIRNLEESFDMKIDMDCTQIGFRTEDNYEVKADDIAILNIGDGNALDKIAVNTRSEKNGEVDNNFKQFSLYKANVKLNSIKEVLNQTSR